MNLSRLRLLTFDITDTLLKFKIAPAKQYGEIAAMYGILCEPNLLATNFKRHWCRMKTAHPNFGFESGLGWEQWWREIVIGTFQDAASGDLDCETLNKVSEHLIKAYMTSNYWRHCFGALDILSYLKHKGIPLGVVSNFDPRLDTMLENAKLRHYFKFVLTSYEAGFEKPDPRIFHVAMKLSNLTDLKPEECLHIGDTASLDYKGALDAQWNAVLIDKSDLQEMQKKHTFLDVQHVYGSLLELHKSFVETSGEKLINIQSKNL